MKSYAIPLVIATTVILVLTTIFAALDLSFSLVFYCTVGGQALLIFTVYKVLTDDYTTDKTFDDFYEDYPIDRDNDR